MGLGLGLRMEAQLYLTRENICSCIARVRLERGVVRVASGAGDFCGRDEEEDCGTWG